MTEIDSLIREMLLSDPEVVAWLTLHDDDMDDEEPAAAA
jgi:hypothetical protein